MKAQKTTVEQNEAHTKTLNKLEKENEFLKQRLTELKHSTTYQLSYHINKVGTFRGFIRFPIAFYRVLKQYKKKNAAKQAKEKAENALFNEFKGDQEAELKRIDQIRYKFKSGADKAGKVKVASILDEFSFNCFAPDCDLFQLSVIDISEQLNKFKPDLIFIESAWQGKNGEWFKKVRHVSPELTEALRWARRNNVPTMLWNKEDPVHFKAFLPIARLVDFVFTTDSRCISEYEKALGHNRVGLLPFAAQPHIHNPIEQFNRIDKFCFAGSYYKNYPQRQADFETLISSVSKFKGVDIYDRNFNVPDSQNVFPEKYQKYILGNLPFEEIAKAYKGYNFGINMNTIKDSPSMFARRVYELMASNTVVVSNYAEGISTVFGQLAINSDDTKQLQQKLTAVCNDSNIYKKMRLEALREVMSKHTYQQRLSFIKSFISGEKESEPSPSVLVVSYIASKEESVAISEQFNAFDYENKSLLFVGLNSIESNYKLLDIKQDIQQLLNTIKGYDYAAFISRQDVYRKNYLTDLVLAFQYADISVSGKVAKHTYDNNEVKLIDDGQQYKFNDALDVRCSLIDAKCITFDWLQKNINEIEKAVLKKEKMLAIDEFNYCQNGANLNSDLLEVVDDLELVNAK